MAEKPRIVILDDNVAFAVMIEAALASQYDLIKGTNGREGMTLLLEAPTDLLITDIGMPEMDGAALLREMKKDPRTARIPVIVLTATHFHQRSRKEFEGDPQVRTIMLKPVVPEELVAAVESALHPGPQRPPHP